MGGVMQGVILASGSQERFDLFLGVRIKPRHVIGLMGLSAVEMLVVFRFVSSHDATPFEFK
jgi:hypothetical protein